MSHNAPLKKHKKRSKTIKQRWSFANSYALLFI